MKSKNFTYLLLALVLFIWGWVGYRVFLALQGSEEPPVLAKNRSTAKEKVNDYAIIKDTVHLMINYRDPFSAEKTKPLSVQPKVVNKVKVTTVVNNWSGIRYTGFIRNSGSKKLIALMSINGKDVMLSEGDMADKVRLIKNRRDSIQVVFEGKTRYIQMN